MDPENDLSGENKTICLEFLNDFVIFDPEYSLYKMTHQVVFGILVDLAADST